MSSPQTIIRDGSGAQTATYQLPPGLFQYIESVLVEVDNGAAVDVTPTLKVATVNGRVMATKRQGEAIQAGNSGTATWALRLDDNAVGIRFDRLNTGGWLAIQTLTAQGFTLSVALGDLVLSMDDPTNNMLLFSAGTLDLQAANGIGLSDAGSQTQFIVDGSHNITAILSSGQKLEVQNHLGNPIFRVNEDGSLQGKTGKALTFNL